MGIGVGGPGDRDRLAGIGAGEAVRPQALEAEVRRLREDALGLGRGVESQGRRLGWRDGELTCADLINSHGAELAAQVIARVIGSGIADRDRARRGLADVNIADGEGGRLGEGRERARRIGQERPARAVALRRQLAHVEACVPDLQRHRRPIPAERQGLTRQAGRREGHPLQVDGRARGQSGDQVVDRDALVDHQGRARLQRDGAQARRVGRAELQRRVALHRQAAGEVAGGLQVQLRVLGDHHRSAARTRAVAGRVVDGDLIGRGDVEAAAGQREHRALMQFDERAGRERRVLEIERIAGADVDHRRQAGRPCEAGQVERGRRRGAELQGRAGEVGEGDPFEVHIARREGEAGPQSAPVDRRQDLGVAGLDARR